MEASLVDLAAQADGIAAERTGTEREPETLARERATEAETQAVTTRARLEETPQRLGAACDVAARTEVLAPEDCTVLASRFFNPGAVVRPGETVRELCPPMIV